MRHCFEVDIYTGCLCGTMFNNIATKHSEVFTFQYVNQGQYQLLVFKKKNDG